MSGSIDLNMQIDLSEFKLEELLGNVDNYLSELITQSAFFLQGELQEGAPVDTGRLRTSFEITRNSDFVYNVYTNIEYAVAANKNAKDPDKRHYLTKSYLKTEKEIIKLSDQLYNQYLNN